MRPEPDSKVTLQLLKRHKPPAVKLMSLIMLATERVIGPYFWLIIVAELFTTTPTRPEVMMYIASISEPWMLSRKALQDWSPKTTLWKRTPRPK